MEVRYIISEAEAQYQEKFKGHFSKKLADWAISMMEKKDESTGKMKAITPIPLEEVEEMMKQQGIKIPEECIYDVLYLANMIKADYEESLPTKEVKAKYIDETINDPDGCPEAVLACFCAKMDLKNMPIHWERFI